MNSYYRSDIEAIGTDWQAVGNYLRIATQEVAKEVAKDTGDKQLVATIAKLSLSKTVLPNPRGLKKLEAIQPGSFQEVLNRAAALQRADQSRSGA